MAPLTFKAISKDECLLCLIAPIIHYLWGFILLPVHIQCPHRSPPTRPCLTLNRKLILVINLTGAILAGRGIWNILNTKGALAREVTVMGLGVGSTTALLYIFCAHLLSPNEVFYANALLKLIERQHTFGVNLTGRGLKTRIGGMISTSVIMPVCGYALTIANLALNAQQLTREFLLVNSPLLAMMAPALSMYFVTLTYCEIYSHFFTACHAAAKRGPQLQHLHRFHIAVYHNFGNIYRVVNNLGALFFVSSSVIMIVSFYSIVSQLRNGALELDFQTQILCLWSVYATLMGCYVLVKISQLLALNQDLVSFLFRFPISTLSPLGACQLEAFITTLGMLRTEMRILENISIGITIIPPVTGVVLTYALVGLQLHKLWGPQ